MQKQFERRSYNFEIRAEKRDKGNVITGRPIVYNSRTNLGAFDEVIDAGALDKADLTDVRFLVNHDISKIPLARSRRNNGNSTMQLRIDKDGMEIDVVLDTENNAEAKALYSAVQRGDITGMSFMFGIDDDEWEDKKSDHPTHHIKRISKIVEVSAVTFPAYEQTEISARSLDALESAKRALEKAQKQASVETDVELMKAKYKFRSMMEG